MQKHYNSNPTSVEIISIKPSVWHKNKFYANGKVNGREIQVCNLDDDKTETAKVALERYYYRGK
jgi:hypothetical protein